MKDTPIEFIDVFLQPGEYHFGDRQVRIRTLLGSCVAVVFWHPKLLVGGMCHFMLPTAGAYRADEAHNAERPLSGRYADEAMYLLMREMKKTGVPYSEYQAKLFGGGDMFSTVSKQAGVQIGLNNIEAARRLVQHHGFDCVAEHLGGEGYRNVIFDIWSGHVWIRYQSLQPSKVNLISSLETSGKVYR